MNFCMIFQFFEFHQYNGTKVLFQIMLFLKTSKNPKKKEMFLDQHIRMISGGSCDWSNDAENPVLE